MSYFPFFIDIKDKNAIIAGGGAVAVRKIEKLSMFECKITVIAPEICDEIKNLSKNNDKITLMAKKIEKDDIKNAFFVICATDDSRTNKDISKYCKEHNIPVNSVDDIQNCSFIFPAIIKDESLTIAISTCGQTPEAAACLKQKIQTFLPQNLGRIISEIGTKRAKLKKTLFDPEERKIEINKLSEDLKNKFE